MGLPIIGGSRERVSQSLFYWNPFCNWIVLLHEPQLCESQSLFYWNPFCNHNLYDYNALQNEVAILILLESFLQLEMMNLLDLLKMRRNPYFIGILSAIRERNSRYR